LRSSRRGPWTVGSSGRRSIIQPSIGRTIIRGATGRAPIGPIRTVLRTFGATATRPGRAGRRTGRSLVSARTLLPRSALIFSWLLAILWLRPTLVLGALGPLRPLLPTGRRRGAGDGVAAVTTVCRAVALVAFGSVGAGRTTLTTPACAVAAGLVPTVRPAAVAGIRHDVTPSLCI